MDNSLKQTTAHRRGPLPTDPVLADEPHVPLAMKRRASRRTKRHVVLYLIGILSVCALVSAFPIIFYTATAPSAKFITPFAIECVHTGSFAVSSSDQLRSVCHAHAPQLENTSWYNSFLQTGRDVVVTALDRRQLFHRSTQTHLIMPYPVCIHLDTGSMFSESAGTRINTRVQNSRDVPRYLRDTQFHDIEALFTYMHQSTLESDATVSVIPAMSVIPFGSYLATHMWHLIYDALGPFLDAVSDAVPAFWDVPRQGVLLDEESARWLDRGGDTPLKQRVSAAITHGLSSFVTNASSSDPAAPPVAAFVKSPLVAHATDRPPYVLDGKHPGFVSNTVCFCQNMFVPTYGVNGQPASALAIATIQDRVALSFGAPPYRDVAEESVWDIERQRIERYPSWARQFWPSASPGGDTQYHPRVLFIHRARRTIANVSVYVQAMRDMGFRVEEVYLERLPTEQQYYLGRYADVVVGMHGLGIGHALWMNRYPTGCRTVIEFRLWAARHAPVRLQNTLGGHLKYTYLPIWPVDVHFGPTVADPALEKKRIIELGHAAFRLPGWDDQEAVFELEEVMRRFFFVKKHLLSCLNIM